MSDEVRIKLPPKLKPVFKIPRGDVRYRCAYGGRGSGKSFSFAQMAAVFGYTEKLRILCVREFQNSIKESFHAEVKSAINSNPWLASNYNVGVDFIKGNNGTEFIFKGLRNNISSVKSLAQIDICIIEEAEDISEAAWLDLEPTIRADKSELWVIWNPKVDGSATDKRFIKSPPPNSLIVEMNYNDNPWFGDVLEQQRLHALNTMSGYTYEHVWLGKYLAISDAQVFKDKSTIKDFEIDHTHGDPYQGLDFGFSQDPTAGIRCYIKDNNLYISHEFGKTGLELDDTAAYAKSYIQDYNKYAIRADCARPESISYLKRKGLPKITGVKKGKGSIEDGIEFIKSFNKVIIHSRCVSVQSEFRLYSYKMNKQTGDILPIIEDKHNHYIDAIRYALEPLMKQKTNLLAAMAKQRF